MHSSSLTRLDFSMMASSLSADRPVLRARVCGLSRLSALTRLRELNFTCAALVSAALAPLSTLTFLRSLHFSGTRVLHLSPLASLPL